MNASALPPGRRCATVFFLNLAPPQNFSLNGPETRELRQYKLFSVRPFNFSDSANPLKTQRRPRAGSGFMIRTRSTRDYGRFGGLCSIRSHHGAIIIEYYKVAPCPARQARSPSFNPPEPPSRFGQGSLSNGEVGGVKKKLHRLRLFSPSTSRCRFLSPPQAPTIPPRTPVLPPGCSSAFALPPPPSQTQSRVSTPGARKQARWPLNLPNSPPSEFGCE